MNNFSVDLHFSVCQSEQFFYWRIPLCASQKGSCSFVLNMPRLLHVCISPDIRSKHWDIFLNLSFFLYILVLRLLPSCGIVKLPQFWALSCPPLSRRASQSPAMLGYESLGPAATTNSVIHSSFFSLGKDLYHECFRERERESEIVNTEEIGWKVS